MHGPPSDIARVRRRAIMIAIIKGLLLGALMWILWDKAGLVGIALVPIGLLGVLYLNQDNLVYIPTRVLRYRTRPDKLPPLQNFDEISLVTLDATKIRCGVAYL